MGLQGFILAKPDNRFY